MGRYSYDNTSVHNSANLFVLREDIHTAYDNFRWTIAPKTPPTATEPKWYFVYLDTTEEMGSQYHNVEMRPMLGLRSQYLLAGFARAIFSLLLPFLNNFAAKRLIGISVGTKDPAGKEVPGEWAAEKFRWPGARGGRKGQSPKRQRTEDPAESCNDSTPNDDDSPPPYSESFQPSKNSHDADDIPCTCLIDTSPVAEHSASPGTGEPPDELVLADVMCRSKNCRTRAEFKHHEALRAEALTSERKKSNVREWWEGQLQWALDCSLRKHRGYDIKQRFWVTGVEEQDKDGEYIDTNEDFGRQVGWLS